MEYSHADSRELLLLLEGFFLTQIKQIKQILGGFYCRLRDFFSHRFNNRFRVDRKEHRYTNIWHAALEMLKNEKKMRIFCKKNCF